MIEQRLLDGIMSRQIYEWHLVNHFPPDEVKPYAIMEKCMEEGRYFVHGYYEEGRIVGYTFLLKEGKDYLLDYFAVLEEMRGLGKCSEILDILKASLKEGETIYIETELPDPDEPEIRAVQFKRIQFYIRNGAQGAGLMDSAFGVPYRVFTLGEKKYGEKAREGMANLYQSMLSKEMYEKNVWFKLDCEN